MTISATTQGIKPGVCLSTNKPVNPFDGQVIYMTDVDQTAVWDGSQWTVLAPIAGGRNKVINGGMSIWQRGTSSAGTTLSYSAADRWLCFRSANAAGSTAYQIIVGGVVAPSNYGLRMQRDSGNTATGNIAATTSFETINVVPLRGQILTLSFYARCGSNYSQASSALSATVFAGTGTDGNLAAGFTSNSTYASSQVTLTTSYQRFTVTGSAALGSTIGQLGVHFSYTPVGTAGANDWFEITGVQLEAGAVATPFEVEDYSETLAKCQRYYQRIGGGIYTLPTQAAGAFSTTRVYAPFALLTSLRGAVTAIDYAGPLYLIDVVNSHLVTSITLDIGNQNRPTVTIDVASGLTQFRPYFLSTLTSSTAYLGVSAEL